jgi:hypothetical protein
MERKMYWNPDGSNYSEVSNTFEYPEGSGRWFNYPSVFGGIKHGYGDAINHFRRNFGIDPETGINYGANVYSDPRVAGQDAADRSPTLGRGYARPVGLELGMLADRADIERTVHSDGSLLRDREGEQRDRDQFMMDVLGTATPFGAITKVDKLARAIAKLPMDEVSRMKRADEMGYNRDAYHGSTRDIREFNTVFGNREGHYGANHYFTNSVDDLGKNYAGEGPDLTQRITEKMERLGDEGIEPSRKAAKEALGIENKGVSYPVKLKLKNPVKTHGKDETFFDYQAKYDEDPSSDYYEEFLGEEGKFIDLIDDTKRVMRNWNVDDVDGVMAKLQDANMDMEGISASQFEDVMRNNIYDLYHPETGQMSSVGELIADVYKTMGYDGVEMGAYKAFGPQKRGGGRWGGEGYMTKGMEGLDQDTLHYIAFEPHQIRSKFAKFDPTKSKSGDILAGVGGTALATPILSERE